MCLGEMATQKDENYVSIQFRWKFCTDAAKYFHAITGLTYLPDYVCGPKK
jgi:hypothetical protein